MSPELQLAYIEWARSEYHMSAKRRIRIARSITGPYPPLTLLRHAREDLVEAMACARVIENLKREIYGKRG